MNAKNAKKRHHGEEKAHLRSGQILRRVLWLFQIQIDIPVGGGERKELRKVFGVASKLKRLTENKSVGRLENKNGVCK